MTARVAALWVYPVKAMAGVALRQARLLPTGIEGDREWLVVDERLRGLTLRECPRLATLTPSYGGSTLSLTGADGDVCQVAVTERPLQVSLFGQAAEALAAAAEVDLWLSDQLGRPARLVRTKPDAPRHCDPVRFGASSMLFADGAPYLVAGSASLAALDRNRDPRRFRANIWLEGMGPFAEHRLSGFATAAAELRLVDACQRCSVILVDPDSGQRTEAGSWLLDVAAVNAMPAQPRAAAFGVNSLLVRGAGEYLQVGETVTPLP